jgi:hypothetical protein
LYKSLRCKQASAGYLACGELIAEYTMSIVTSPSPPIESSPEPVPAHYLNVAFGVRSWLLTTDHKRIAWKATGLEWQTASPPPTDNFAVTPIVTVGPYEYASESIEVVG